MGDDASIDDFVPGDDDESVTDDRSGDADGEPAVDDEELDARGEPDGSGDAAATGVVSPSSVTPAASTSRVAPDGGSCSACDADVERLWFDGDDAVCAACKSW
ncbi:hypothetical protein G9C85_09990 [Halorubellus sp. JP-L1]|uniref:DUF7573 domain-containing protein n=1 Tax=Halorubellus sp. JP-L1 TaxID=2715753 RepID=UPI00140DA3FF|nr:hypothetical protein [Halorubellus sp. JP-L1]NHN41957.1 hypothetical protein [Halorubellus sp. JP-L1]